MSEPTPVEQADEAIRALDALRKTLLPLGFISVSAACGQLANILNDWVEAYRSEQQKPGSAKIQLFRGPNRGKRR